MALGWLLIAASPPQQQRGQPDRIARDPAANSLQNGAAPPAEAQNQPNSYTADCEQGRDNRRSDLCAQWKAADAARDAAGWAGWTWWLGVGGVFLGLGTLGAAVAAAWFAKKAADHARSSANAANVANRPWLEISVNPEFATTTTGKMIIGVQLTIKNIGNTPAQKVRYEVEQIQGGKYGGDHEFFDTPHQGKLDRPHPVRAVLPGGDIKDQELVFVPWADTGKNVPIIGVNVTYDLPDGTSAQSSVSFYVGRILGEPGQLGSIEPNTGNWQGLVRADRAWFEKFT